MGRDEAIRSLERLSDDSRRIINVCNNEPDLPAALVTTSYLDAGLRTLLAAFFRESSVANRLLDSTRGALGTFASRADLAYALGLIPKPLYQDVMRIAEIRNKFAHTHLEVTFDSDDVRGLCAELHYLETLSREASADLRALFDAVLPPRARFLASAVVISHRIMGYSSRLQRVPECVER